jgi:hypothetical protein
MRLKPPAGIPVGILTHLVNVFAIVGNNNPAQSFDPPYNARTSWVPLFLRNYRNETSRVIQEQLVQYLSLDW